jgi:preprotein translocase subunit SecE
MAENNAPEKAKEEKSEKTSFSKSLKSEFAKIIWPSKDDLTKQTIAVVCVSVLMGILISLIDMGLGYGITSITGGH